MAAKLIWSPEAVEDLEQIARFIERDSPMYARAVVSRVVETAESITAFPRMGRVVPELGTDTIRERFVYSYRLVYRLSDESTLVLAVIHGRRLLENLTDRW